MLPRRALWVLFFLLPLFVPVVSEQNVSLDSSRRLQAWLNDTFLQPPPDNTSMPQVCDYSQQAWAQHAIRFKINGTQFMTLAGPEPCAQARKGDLLNDFKFDRHVPLRKELSGQNGYVGIPFREHSDYQDIDLLCKIYAGSFIRNISSLYALIEPIFPVKGFPLDTYSYYDRNEPRSPVKDFLPVQISKPQASKEGNSTAQYFYIYLGPEDPTVAKNPFSFFMQDMTMNDVPGYKNAVDDANGRISIHQERVKELSPSNTAILLLPMLLSFLPASAVTDNLSAYRTLAYAIATDFLTNIPILIKGAEFLYISSLQSPGGAARTLLTGNAQVQFVEIWVTQCEKTLGSFRLGFAFVFFGIWAMAVGFTTEFLIWKFDVQKREIEQMNKGNFFGTESQSQSTVSENQGREPFRKRMKRSQNKATKDSSSPLISENNCRKRKHSDMASEAEYEFGPDDSSSCGSSWKEDAKELAFFFAGVALSFLVVIPFLGFIFLRHHYFKKTERREWFFKIGTMVGSMNMAYIFVVVIFNLVLEEFFVAFVLFFDLVLFFVLRKSKCQLCACFPKTAQAQAESRTNGTGECRETRFYVAGLFLGLLVSVFSNLYLRRFPWIRRNKRRRRMLKIGFMVGAFTNLVVLDFVSRRLFDRYFPSLILLYNVVFLVALVLCETDLVRCTARERPNRSGNSLPNTLDP